MLVAMRWRCVYSVPRMCGYLVIVEQVVALSDVRVVFDIRAMSRRFTACMVGLVAEYVAFSRMHPIGKDEERVDESSRELPL